MNNKISELEKIAYDSMSKFKEAVSGVLAIQAITFEDNLVLASGCDNYGCTCIAYEKCCGCFIQ